MLATWLSKLNISTRIIDKRNTKVFTGQADGVQCRYVFFPPLPHLACSALMLSSPSLFLLSTVEVFQSFGFAERLVKEGAHINEVAHWEPKEGGGIRRTKRTPDNEPGTSRFPHAVLTQGRIERFMLDAMKEFSELSLSLSQRKELTALGAPLADDLEVHRSIQPTSLAIDPTLLTDFTSHAITVTLRHLSEEEATPTQVGTVANGLFRSNLLTDEEADANPPSVNGDAGKEEMVKAKFVVGCDGARSWVRK